MRAEKNDQRLFSLRLHCSNVCNHRCDYCHVFKTGQSTVSGPQLMGPDVARAAIDAYARITRDREDAHVKIGFYGGEPMMNWRMIKQVLTYGNRTFRSHRRVHWILNTNGTVMTPQIAEDLRQEGVDIHLSIDGPDGGSNRYRKFRSGRAVIGRVRESIETLGKFGCRIQFNTCLSNANCNSLTRLIDFAAQNGADRIYIAIPDSAAHRSSTAIDADVAASKIAAAVNYGLGKGVRIGGPWRQAISGAPGSLAAKYAVPNFFIDPSGQVYLFAYPWEPLGEVDRLEEILLSKEFKRLTTQWDQETLHCRGCRFENTCAGYLKGMVMYHTGKAAGFDKECRLAKAIDDELTAAQSPGVSNASKLKVSRLLGVQRKGHGAMVVQRVARTGVKASSDLLELLDQFREPINPNTIQERYAIANLQQLLAQLVKLRFLLPERHDEEIEWLGNTIDLGEKDFVQNENFRTCHPKFENRAALDFQELMQSAIDLLAARGLPSFGRSILVNICKDREEFKKFWGRAHLPEWPKAFVANGCLIIADHRKILKSNRQSDEVVRRMAHELVHVFLHQSCCRLPVWLEEGLCEYFSREYVPGKFWVLAIQKGIYGFREMELTARHSLLDLDPAPVDENMCYRQSHSFVAWLAGLSGDKKLLDCVLCTGFSKDFRAQFEHFCGVTIDDAEQKWLQHGAALMPGPAGIGDNLRKLKISRNLRTIQKGRKALVYNAFYGQSLKADPALLQLLAGLKKGRTLGQIEKEIKISGLNQAVTELYDKNLVIFDDRPEDNAAYTDIESEHAKTGRLINSLRLNVSNACNMTCGYCYIEKDLSSGALMQWPVAQKALDGFFDLQRQAGRDKAQIRFFGGEPLLNWKLIKQIFDYVDILKKSAGIHYILNTNGTIAGDQIVDELAERRVVVAISLDGKGAVHDSCRKLVSGKSAFRIIDRNLDRFLSRGCKVGVETTLGDHNFDHLKELIDYLADKADKFGHPIPLALQNMCMPSGRKLDSKPLAEKAEKIIEAMAYAEQKDIAAHDGMVFFPFNALLGRKPRGRYCRAMGEELCVHPNGDIYPCGALDIKLGSIDNLGEVLTSAAYSKLCQRVAGNIPGCRGCDIETYCAGGCAADAVAESADLFQPTRNCRFEKSVFKALVENLLLNDKSASRG